LTVLRYAGGSAWLRPGGQAAQGAGPQRSHRNRGAQGHRVLSRRSRLPASPTCQSLLGLVYFLVLKNPISELPLLASLLRARSASCGGFRAVCLSSYTCPSVCFGAYWKPKSWGDICLVVWFWSSYATFGSGRPIFGSGRPMRCFEVEGRSAESCVNVNAVIELL
jgi:hypothetical protein